MTASNPYPLDFIEGDFVARAIVELCCARAFVRCHELGLFQRAAVFRDNWLRVFPGRQICLKAAAELDFQPLPPDRVKSGFLEGQNGWKPPWASDSHAIGSRIV